MCSPILEDLDISEAARALWKAPFAVLSHNRFEDDEPRFTYANQVSLQLSPHWSCRIAMPFTTRQSLCSVTCNVRTLCSGAGRLKVLPYCQVQVLQYWESPNKVYCGRADVYWEANARRHLGMVMAVIACLWRCICS